MVWQTMKTTSQRAGLCAMLLAAYAAAALGQTANAPSVAGTWKGESVCAGNRPACKYEVVVYRFVPVAGKPAVMRLLADKIINGERVPMGALEFQYDQTKGTLSCEFTAGSTHGLWQFQVSGDALEGSLVILPDKALARKVKAKRANLRDVPPAPAEKLYDGN
ncbi:MAG: hypothetical protein HYR56_01080 [Acidobacteria bacterium]|nr:hypothetical protein [Acidobacteriota bacterium]MBI3426915.1 hypothetical protein [Acidobacteriota bacterium]